MEHRCRPEEHLHLEIQHPPRRCGHEPTRRCCSGRLCRAKSSVQRRRLVYWRRSTGTVVGRSKHASTFRRDCRRAVHARDVGVAPRRCWYARLGLRHSGASGGGTAPPAAPPDTSLKKVPGSDLSFTRQQICDGFGPADWFPGDHPRCPRSSPTARRPDVRACGLCHYPNGKGRPENAGVVGLPGVVLHPADERFPQRPRKSAEPRKANTNAMIAIAKAMTAEEIKATAEYFGAMKWTPWIRVVETNTVPKMESRAASGSRRGHEKEPIGVRIIETPENSEPPRRCATRARGFIAYAPVGSIKKGEALDTGGNGKTTHARVPRRGSQGLGPVPGSPGARPAIWCGRCTTCRRARVAANGAN